MFIGLSSFVSLTVTREVGIIITSRYITARFKTILGCLGFDLFDIIDLTTWIQALGNTKWRLVLFHEIFLTPFQFLFRFMILLDISGPVTQGPSQAFLDGFLFGTFSKEIIRAVLSTLVLRHSSLLSQYTVTLGTTTLGDFINLLLTVWWYTSPCLLLKQHPCVCISVRIV